MAPIYFDEISNDDILIFTPNAGISINLSKDRFLVFTKATSKWKMSSYSLEDFRSFEVHTPGADEFVTFGRQGIGAALGVAARNASEKKKARSATGININLRRTDRPSLFLNITDERKRASATEALRQLCEEGRLREPYSTGEKNIATAWRRPTEEEVNEARLEEAERKRKQQAWETSLWPSRSDAATVLGLSAAVAVLAWFAYRQLVFANVERYVDFFAEDIVIFFVVALPFIYLFHSWIKVKRMLRQPRPK